jgi:hypothetical protein
VQKECERNLSTSSSRPNRRTAASPPTVGRCSKTAQHTNVPLSGTELPHGHFVSDWPQMDRRGWAAGAHFIEFDRATLLAIPGPRWTSMDLDGPQYARIGGSASARNVAIRRSCFEAGSDRSPTPGAGLQQHLLPGFRNRAQRLTKARAEYQSHHEATAGIASPFRPMSS